jgi:peptide/nickel transport system substrate-binding protein
VERVPLRVWNADAVEHMGLIGLGNSLFDAALAYTLITVRRLLRRQDQLVQRSVRRARRGGAGRARPERRAELYDEVYQVVADERVMIFLFQLENLVGIADDVDWTPRPDELLWMFDARPAR